MECTLKAVSPIKVNRYKKNLFLIPYIFTFANALCGFLSIIAALEGRFIVSALYIGLAACMDACDGRLARAFGSTSYLGAELDGLCDAISFCSAPPLLLYCYFQNSFGILGFIALGFYLCSGLFRLAKFNITPSANPGYFNGLSTPVSAFFLASFIIYHDWFIAHNLCWLIEPRSITFLVIMLSGLMISSIPFPSFKSNKGNNLKCYLLLAAIIAAFILSISMSLPSLLVVLTTYIIISIVDWLLKTLMVFLKSNAASLELKK